jgi:hypothetical protein
MVLAGHLAKKLQVTNMNDEFEEVWEECPESEAIDWLEHDKKLREHRRYQPVDEEEEQRVSLYTSLWDSYD